MLPSDWIILSFLLASSNKCKPLNTKPRETNTSVHETKGYSMWLNLTLRPTNMVMFNVSQSWALLPRLAGRYYLYQELWVKGKLRVLLDARVWIWVEQCWDRKGWKWCTFGSHLNLSRWTISLHNITWTYQPQTAPMTSLRPIWKGDVVHSTHIVTLCV